MEAIQRCVAVPRAGVQRGCKYSGTCNVVRGHRRDRAGRYGAIAGQLGLCVRLRQHRERRGARKGSERRVDRRTRRSRSRVACGAGPRDVAKGEAVAERSGHMLTNRRAVCPCRAGRMRSGECARERLQKSKRADWSRGRGGSQSARLLCSTQCARACGDGEGLLGLAQKALSRLPPLLPSPPPPSPPSPSCLRALSAPR